MSLRKSWAFIASVLAVISAIAGIMAWWIPSSAMWLDHHGFMAWPFAALFLVLFVWAASNWHQSTQELNGKLAEQELKAKSREQVLEAKLAEYALVPADRELFGAFKTFLSKDSRVMAWLRSEADTRLFRDSDVQSLRDFVRTWQDADYHFVNQELEQVAQKLVAAGSAFLSYQALNSVPAPRHLQSDRNNFVYRYVDPDDIDQRRRREIDKGLGDRADRVLDAHNELYMVGSRLGL